MSFETRFENQEHRSPRQNRARANSNRDSACFFGHDTWRGLRGPGVVLNGLDLFVPRWGEVSGADLSGLERLELVWPMDSYEGSAEAALTLLKVTEMPNLRHLVMNGWIGGWYQIGDGLATLKLPRLETLDITHSTITAEQIERIRIAKGLPALQSIKAKPDPEAD